MRTLTCVALLSLCGTSTVLGQEPVYRNSLGMEFIRIEPGSMQVGVFQPVCPSPTTGRGAPAPPAGPDREGGPPPVGRGGGRGPTDPRAAWSAEDYARCAELVAADSSNGFSVTIAKPFYLGKYEVTQEQWTKVMGTNPSVFQGAKVSDDASKHPVDNVTWADAQAFIKKLNAMDRTSIYRLPTEFEWEYAGRAGDAGQTSWTVIRQVAVLGRGGARGPTGKATTAAVGSKPANAWGLHDMLGNVWEWVDDYYNDKLFADPKPPIRGTVRVLKGGGFLSDVKNAIYATHAAGPGSGFDVGFRVARDAR